MRSTIIKRTPSLRNAAPSCLAAVAALAALAVSGCDWMPGKPTAAERWQPESAVLDFQQLFSENCLGCHGDGQTISPVITLNNPVYLAILPTETLRKNITQGISGRLMPAFAESHGGMLTEKQIDVLVKGISAWKKPVNLPDDLPPYSAPPGDPVAGKTVYDAYRDALKAALGPEMFQDGFLTNPAFLGLSSNQYLRTLIMTGRPALGIPDWRSAIPDRPLSDQDISDIVAYLISQRKNKFGQPLHPTPLSAPSAAPASTPAPTPNEEPTAS